MEIFLFICVGFIAYGAFQLGSKHGNSKLASEMYFFGDTVSEAKKQLGDYNLEYDGNVYTGIMVTCKNHKNEVVACTTMTPKGTEIYKPLGG